MNLQNFLDSLFDSLFDVLYSKDKKYIRYLLILTTIGFFLRLIAALNLGVLADDMVYASQSAGIWGAKIISTHSNPPLFFYLTDLAYKIFGYTTLASRFWLLIFGTLLIPLVFLLTKHFFNERIALLSSFFVTFSNFLIRMTFTEASLVVLFFIFFATLFGLFYLKKANYFFLIFSAIFFGIALLLKYNTPFFIFSFLLFSLFFLNEKKGNFPKKENRKKVLLFFLIIFIFAIPFLSFNYILYKDKGIVDVYFSRIVPLEKTQKLYGGLAGQDTTFFKNLFTISNYNNIGLLYHTDIVLLLFGLFGFLIVFKRKEKNCLAFLLIFLLIPFILQSAGSTLQKHFVFIPFLFSIPAGYFLNELFNHTNKRYLKITILVLLTTLMIINLGNRYGTPESYYYKSDVSKLKGFINDNVKPNDLLIFDSRIYTAQSFWVGTDKNLLNLHDFISFYNYNQNLTNGQKVPTRVYVIECLIDDCGWGWIAKNQELNKSSENILSILRNNSREISTINSYNYQGNELLGKKEKIEKFRVYALELNLNPELVKQTKYINSFYFVPYMYLNMENYLFNYPNVGFNKLVHNLSLLIIYFSVFLAILSILLLFALILLKDKLY